MRHSNGKGLAAFTFALGVVVGMLVRLSFRSTGRKAEHDIAVEKLRHSGEFFLGGMSAENAPLSEHRLEAP